METIEYTNNVLNVRLRDGRAARIRKVTHDRFDIQEIEVEIITDDEIATIDEYEVQFPNLVLDTPELREQGGDYDALWDDANYLVIQA